MEKEEVSAGERISIGDVTLIPIVRTVVHCDERRDGVYGFASKSVVAVVVVSPEGQRAITVSGEDVPLTDYAESVPEVAELLNATQRPASPASHDSP